jgi:hypothetical protein
MLRRAVTLSVASSTSARGTGLGTVGLLHHLCQQYGHGHRLHFRPKAQADGEAQQERSWPRLEQVMYLYARGEE